MAYESVLPHRTFTNSKISLRAHENDGDDIVKVESREDEEQNIKLQEIIDLLLAAGYFRARIKGLSSFDKVVGGMTWCIEMCNFDVDIDLLFQENLTIGQKISLTEKIVGVLPKMNCPHRLEPHQMQGLDFIHIFPVIQWLVKRAIETREEIGDYTRSYSISQFNKFHCMPEDTMVINQEEKAVSTICHVLDIYKPHRQYRRHKNVIPTIEELCVKSTLLEYGRFVGSFKEPALQKDKSDKKSCAPESVPEDSRLAAEQVKTLMSAMSVMDDQEHRLSASAVGTIVGLKSAEIQQITSEYKDKQSELLISDNSEKLGETHRHMRLVATLRKQIENRKNCLEKMEQSLNEHCSQYESTKEKRRKLEKLIKDTEDEMESFEEIENDENQGLLQKLRTLVAMNECLKQQEHEFKLHCKEEMCRLHSNIEDLKSNSMENDTGDQEQTQVVETQYLVDKEKFYKIRLHLARKNREIAILQRKIDEVPSRAELSQYQRRFVELYNQVAAKHKETKQFYTLYNSLDDTKLYLSKEVNLLNSILDNFTEAMLSPTTREQFLKQFEQIVENIKINKSKLEKKKQEEKMRRDCLNDTYLDFVEKQRLYFKTVKDLKEECRKNEILLAKLKAQG